MAQLRRLQSENLHFSYGRRDSTDEELMDSFDTQLYRISQGVNEILGDSYHYIRDNHGNQNDEYAQVVNVARKLNNFHKMKINLVDSGCLSSESEVVRKLSLGILETSLNTALIQEDCDREEAPSLADALVDDMDQILYCLRNPDAEGECPENKPHKKGLFGYSIGDKIEIMGSILEHKRRLDHNSMVFLDYAFTGRCDDGEEICAHAKEEFPEMSEGPADLVGKINRQLTAFNRRARGEEEFVRNISALLRFSSRVALEKCVPEIYDYLQERSGRPKFDPISTADLGCMHAETKGLIEKTNKEGDYRSSLARFQRNLGNAPEDGSARNRRRRSVIDRSVDSGMKEMFLYDPIAFSSYLVSDGSGADFINLCNTIMEIAKKIEAKDFRFNVAFSGLNIGALALIGLSFVVTGPLAAAVSVVASGIAVADGSLYWIKEGKYQKQADSADSISTQSRFIQGFDEELAYDIFRRDMEERLHYLDEKKSAAFWKWFAFGFGALAVGGTVTALASGHLGQVSGGLSKSGKWAVRQVAKGGAPGRAMANALTKAAETGDHAVADLMHALADPDRYHRIIVQAANSPRLHAAASKAHGLIERAHRVGNPFERSSAAYWARSYSRATLRTMARALRGASRGSHSTREGLSYGESVYEDLDIYINSASR